MTPHILVFYVYHWDPISHAAVYCYTEMQYDHMTIAYHQMITIHRHIAVVHHR